MKNLQEVKEAVIKGKKVYWKTGAYEVINPSNGFMIKCNLNDHYVYLTNDYNPNDFFIEGE